MIVDKMSHDASQVEKAESMNAPAQVQVSEDRQKYIRRKVCLTTNQKRLYLIIIV
jgi:hypothetical protein